MSGLSLKGHVHVNLADFFPNGPAYPWIGERQETPDIPRNDREIFLNNSVIVNP